MVKALVFGTVHQRFVRSNRTEVGLYFGMSTIFTLQYTCPNMHHALRRHHNADLILYRFGSGEHIGAATVGGRYRHAKRSARNESNRCTSNVLRLRDHSIVFEREMKL